MAYFLHMYVLAPYTCHITVRVNEVDEIFITVHI